MRFTADDAFEMSEAGEPIMLSWSDASKIIRDHSANPSEYYQDKCSPDSRMNEIKVDAADVLGWLGY